MDEQWSNCDTGPHNMAWSIMLWRKEIEEWMSKCELKI